jgi:hypothetical protein
LARVPFGVFAADFLPAAFFGRAFLATGLPDPTDGFRAPLRLDPVFGFFAAVLRVAFRPEDASRGFDVPRALFFVAAFLPFFVRAFDVAADASFFLLLAFAIALVFSAVATGGAIRCRTPKHEVNVVDCLPAYSVVYPVENLSLH